MIRLLVFLFTALMLVGCGESKPGTEVLPPTVATEPAARTPAPEPAPMIDSEDDQLATIRTDYQRIEAARKAGALAKDSLSYYCENAMTEGSIYLYTDDSGLVLATHSRGTGSHGGISEKYYFREGELVFHFQEAGHWQFGGSMITNPDGSEMPGTIDYTTEERRYYNSGEIIKALTKSYKFENGVDKDGSANAATIDVLAATGPPPGKAVLDAAIATRKVDCGLITKLVEG